MTAAGMMHAAAHGHPAVLAEAGMTEVVRAAAGCGHGGQGPPGAEVEGAAGLERDVAVLVAYFAAQPAVSMVSSLLDGLSFAGRRPARRRRAAAGQPGRLATAMIRRG